MAILNRPTHGQPSILIALWRTLAACGSVEHSELVELCTPPPQFADHGQVRNTLNTAVALGLITDTGGHLRLAPALASVPTDSELDPLFMCFRSVVTQAVLANQLNQVSVWLVPRAVRGPLTSHTLCAGC